ncbi:class I adenylate-forming enzyme family protein [Brevibacterium jeotgali]|uniref:Long-chain acyl-CoA synthetase n=1 Tax=Brevibacterium jeotgali TaxID=1262550 RepID=A0A2H1L6K7_9MICO|nr:AMP-binding protein [Brevibacterium jeotgali]TWC02618.1 long-chain acyl-CoA synthetase [Brevibacterium jeotgali]SMY12528.1 long-chain acyl-CoA synthetase [Brevibacterium jeotgali]
MSWFDERPWLRTLGLTADEAAPLEPSTPLQDLADTVAAHPATVAWSHYGESATYTEFDRQTTAFAAYLAESGIRPGDAVAVYAQNSPHFPIATYGIWKAGAVVVPLNPMYRDELTHAFADADVKAIVVQKALHLMRVKEYTADLPLVVLAGDLDWAQDGPDAVFGAYADLPDLPLPDLKTVVDERLDTDFEPVAVRPEDPALIGYTSGTSGKAKGALHPHASISSNSRMAARNARLPQGAGIMSLAPLFHITGFICQMIASSANGSTLVLNHRFDPASFLDLLRHEKPAFMAGPATVYTAMMASPKFGADAFESFSSIMSGGAPLPEGLVKRFEERTGHYIGQGYGLTETAAQAVTVPRGLRAPVDPESGNLSTGLPQRDAMVRILDDEGNPLGPREVGEVAIGGPMVADEYLGNPQATADSMPGGELRTGDVGFMDADGWVFIVDRKKDMINASGFKVWPREVEDILYMHPAVREGAVVGVPDEYRGETVVAFVSLQPDAEATAEDIIAHCKEHLASYKAPVEVTVVEELPKTSSGKILRRTVRDEATAARKEQPGSH